MTTITIPLYPNGNSNSLTIHASCHCRTFTSSFSLPRTVFPLKSSICHCSICRHTSGQIFATFAVIPLPTKPDHTGLTPFDSSESITRWFCGTCGCSVWNDDRGNGEWELCTGVISGVTDGDDGKGIGNPPSRGFGSPEGVPVGMMGLEGLLDRVQLWVGATGDGGGAVWIHGGEGKGKGMVRCWEARGSEVVDDVVLEEMVREGREKERVDDVRNGNGLNVKARCGCGSVKLNVSREDTSVRFQAGMDACWSCRKTSGFELISWATIPVACCSWADGTAVTLDEDVLGKYKCSVDTTRCFCRKCGALIFWIRDESDTWDVSVGLLETEGGGTRLEGWFVWTKYADRKGGVAWIEDAVDGAFVAGLVEGIQKDKQETES